MAAKWCCQGIGRGPQLSTLAIQFLLVIFLFRTTNTLLSRRYATRVAFSFHKAVSKACRSLQLTIESSAPLTLSSNQWGIQCKLTQGDLVVNVIMFFDAARFLWLFVSSGSSKTAYDNNSLFCRLVCIFIYVGRRFFLLRQREYLG